MTGRLADRVTRSEPARGPLQLHHLDRKTEICCVRCGQRSQTRVVATIEQDWTRLVDRGCYDTWFVNSTPARPHLNDRPGAHTPPPIGVARPECLARSGDWIHQRCPMPPGASSPAAASPLRASGVIWKETNPRCRTSMAIWN
jgi:hypothetical protein